MLTLRDATGGWVPDVSLTTQESFDFLHYFVPLISGYSTLSINPCHLVNDEGCCRRMGLGCQPHYARIIWFLGLFFTAICGYSTLTSHLCRPVNVEERCRQMGPGCQPHKMRSVWFLGLFFTAICGSSTLTFHPAAMLTLRDADGWWVPNVSLTIQETLWYLDYFLPVILHQPDFIFDPVRQTTLLADGSPRSASQYKKTCTKKNAWTKIRTQDFSLWNMRATPCHCTNMIIV